MEKEEEGWIELLPKQSKAKVVAEENSCSAVVVLVVLSTVKGGEEEEKRSLGEDGCWQGKTMREGNPSLLLGCRGPEQAIGGPC